MSISTVIDRFAKTTTISIIVETVDKINTISIIIDKIEKTFRYDLNSARNAKYDKSDIVPRCLSFEHKEAAAVFIDDFTERFGA